MSNWILTDDSTGQHMLKPDPVDNVFHFIDTVARGIDRHAVIVGTVSLDADGGYDVHSPDFAALYLHSYGYASLDDVQRQYGEAALQIVAECIFETQAACSDPPIFEGTLNACLDYIEAYVQNRSAIPTPLEGGMVK